MDSPWSGGAFSFLKLSKFRGKDYGRTKLFQEEADVEQVSFPPETTLKDIFLNDSQYGQIVYLRNKELDLQIKQTLPGQKKDEVLEENLLDVKKLLK